MGNETISAASAYTIKTQKRRGWRMAIKTRSKDKKDRWRIFDVIDFFTSIVDVIFFLPRSVFRFLKEL